MSSSTSQINPQAESSTSQNPPPESEFDSNYTTISDPIKLRQYVTDLFREYNANHLQDAALWESIHFDFEFFSKRQHDQLDTQTWNYIIGQILSWLGLGHTVKIGFRGWKDRGSVKIDSILKLSGKPIKKHPDNPQNFSKSISESLYIPRLSRKIRTYVQHCPACQFRQTKRHKPYKELMPISRNNSRVQFF